MKKRLWAAGMILALLAVHCNVKGFLLDGGSVFALMGIGLSYLAGVSCMLAIEKS